MQMARAKRHFLPGHVWHLTHRCHKKDFLLKFVKDRQRWLYWLFQAKNRYGLQILNYMVTSNHVHLLVVDGGSRDTIPRSIQLIAGRTAQEYNQRKYRNGAFWQDRYHATAVQTNEHLIKCITYIDLNMVRAGVVKHPQQWVHSGYNEIQEPRQRYGIIDFKNLMALLQIKNFADLKETHRQWIEVALKKPKIVREDKWTQSIAVGDKWFLEQIKDTLGIRAIGRKIHGTKDEYQLREGQTDFGDWQDFANSNSFDWNLTP
jgi:REP element-mobilizing transposase RayT